MTEKQIDAEFEKWFAIPLDGFPDYIQNMVKNACRLSYKKGYLSRCENAESGIIGLLAKLLPIK